jgi:sugar phosphate permease
MSAPSAPAAAPAAVAPRLPPGFATAFAVTWLSYASYYLGRKGYAVSKTQLARDYGASATYGVETAYLAAYAVGLWASGLLGDRIGARRLVGVGMLGVAGAVAAFGAGSSFTVFFAAFLLNGLLQATGWPGNVKAMAEWTTPSIRGVAMGLWATCYQVGGMVATPIATALLVAWGWRAAFFAPAVWIGAVGLLVLALLRPGPGAAAPHRDPVEAGAARRAARRAVLASPAIWSYGAAYFAIKLMRYSLLFWLPWYLEKGLGYSASTAGYASTSFEIGGIAGTIGLGLLSDRVKRFSRAAFAAASLVALAGAFVLYQAASGLGLWANFAAMALVGALLFGPDALLSGVATQEVGGAAAAGVAAGVVNSVGSLGAILQELVTRGVSSRFGWPALFQVFVGLSLVAALCLTPALRARRPVADDAP